MASKQSIWRTFALCTWLAEDAKQPEAVRSPFALKLPGCLLPGFFSALGRILFVE